MVTRKTKYDGLSLEQGLANNNIKKNGHWVTKSGEHVISNHASEAHRFRLSGGKVHFESAVRDQASKGGGLGYGFGTVKASRRSLTDKTGLSGFTPKQVRHFNEAFNSFLKTSGGGRHGGAGHSGG